jgi:protein gp37
MDVRSGEMSSQSAIEWTDATWNPVRGCTKISPGCKHCYAETFAERFRGVKGHSMSDLFHNQVPENYIEAVARVMVAANWHTYQVLTKRSDRINRLLNSRLAFVARQPHIWWGVSVEDRKYGLPRIADLQSAAAVRFLSVEPLWEDIGTLNLNGINWVIVGGESGPGARLIQKEWVVSIRDQCRRAKVPFFFKQWGGTHKSVAGRELDGRTYDEFPPRVQRPVLAMDECRSLVTNFNASAERFDLVSVM